MMTKAVEALSTNEEIQDVGVDIGRGCVKAFSKFKGKTHQTMFKSIISYGRNLRFDDYEHPLYVEVNDGYDYFVGNLAELEGYIQVHYTSDEKVGDVVEVLLCTALIEVAVADKVRIALGVPKKMYRRSVLNEVINAYKGKTFKIKNKINGSHKEITIVDITIYREADSAIIEQYEKMPELFNCKVGMAVMGFKTLELAYYNEGFEFNDRKSTTIELGNITMLKFVQDELQAQGLDKSLAEIDSSSNYDELKLKGNKALCSQFNRHLKDAWQNLSDVTIFCAGGTLLNLKDFPEFNYELVDQEPQMAVARGLFLVAEKQFS